MYPEDIERLFKAAEDALAKAIAPYSGFKVGASIITEGGRIYTGCNIENPSLMLSFCAERAALIKALTEGEKSFKAMAIVSNKGDYCFPCGSCRQVIEEFAPKIDIYLLSVRGIKKYSISELLPHAFRNP
ncbi:MAG: cytidine deaminase [Thermodesulfovibrionales bacterium]